ncbi:MAG: transposase [Oscillibacter sp.]|nr:transposase [Oscillibacter sp.]
MRALFKSLKTEIKPTPEQRVTLFKAIGTCGFVYNLFLAEADKRYREGPKYMGAYDFSLWLNHAYLSENPDKVWIKETYAKAVKQAIINANTAYQRFFKGLANHPNFKKKGVNEPSYYFVRNGAKQPVVCERHKIKVPGLGWVALKEYGYFPTAANAIHSGSISLHAGRFFCSVLVEVPDMDAVKPETKGIGVDLGINSFAVVSDGREFPNVNRTRKVGKLEKRLKREQRRLSRKRESQRKNSKKGKDSSKRYAKQRLKVQKLHDRLDCIRKDSVRQTVAALVKAKPEFVAIEDLNVRGMMRNRHLSKAVAQQNFYGFRNFLTWKCKMHGIPLHIVDRWYPSSKTCHFCGTLKADLKLSDRSYVCEGCGTLIDRDLNAALNIRDTTQYVLA